jgi:TonB family protein
LPNDLVVVYICSRVVPSADKKSYRICVADSMLTDSDDTCILLDSFLSDLKRFIQSKYIICILDVMPIDESVPQKNIEVIETIRELASRTGVSVFSANELGYPSCDSPTGLDSSFTHYLLEGIKTNSGTMPLNMVSQYVKQNVEQECLQAYQKTQEPVLDLSENSNVLAMMSFGAIVKNSLPKDNFQFGHPMDTLGLDRPDLAERTNFHNTITIEPRQQGTNEPEAASFSRLDFDQYLDHMKQSIQKQWKPPSGLENRSVATVFTIAKDGTIANESIIESSGHKEVDQSALQALKAASPLEPLPPGSPQSVQIRYKFDWHVTATK